MLELCIRNSKVKSSHVNEMQRLKQVLKKTEFKSIPPTILAHQKPGTDITIKLKNNFSNYLSEIENITNRSIPDNQRNELKKYIQNNPIVKLPPNQSKEHRKEFNHLRASLIKEWEQNTRQKWPVYTTPVYSNGEIVRMQGHKYDAHHIIESSYNGANAWWNLHPAKFPTEHQAGIHASGRLAEKLFGN